MRQALIAIVPRISAEDVLMARTFGDNYREYRQNTAAIVPFLI
jgi:protein-S-isoprenylcysteine O-methyltransferase Ste14